MEHPLSGQVALVTGGAGLIGAAITRRLAALGATVVINGRDVAKAERLAHELREAGHSVMTRCANVRDESAVAEMVHQVAVELGRIDIVVNNAGGVGVAGARGAARVTDLTVADWQAVLDLNLTGAFLVTRATLPLMLRRGYGRFINISSAGYFGVMGLSNYAAAKRGLIAFTKTVALENATLGVTANVVVPHLVESPGWTNRPSAMRDAVLAPVPMKRFGTPDEIAHAVAFFASPEAGYITGEVLHVTGGLEWLGTSIDMAAPPR